VPQTHLFECLQRTLMCLTARYATHPEGVGNVLGGVQMSNEVVRLKDEGNMLTACYSSLGVAGGAHVLAQYFQLTFGGLIE
jgi:hypothetical protein